MRRIVKIIAGFVLTLLLLLVSVPFLVPVDALKNQAVAQIEKMTGRKVGMGKVSLSLFPNIALSADDVTIGNPQWVKDGGTMVEVKNLRIGVELMPVLQKDVHVTDISLDTPKIHLLKQGERSNWQFSSADTKKEDTTEAKTGVTKATPAPLRLDSLSVTNGSFIFEDSISATKHLITSVNAKLVTKDLSKSITLSGDGVYNGTKAVIALTLGTPFDLPLGPPSTIALKATVKEIILDWNGTLSLKGGKPSVTGTFKIPELNTTTLAPASSGGNGEARQAINSSAERWSSAPISMQALGAANADVNVEIGKLILTKMTLNNVKAHVKLQNGMLQAVVDELKLFSGAVKLAVTAQQAGGAGIKASMSNVQIEELLSTLAQSKIMAGTLNGAVDIAMRGNSQRAMVSSLAGGGNFVLTDGSYRGGNLLDMTKNVATSFQRGTNEAGRTDFKELSGTFTAKDGVIFNDDLSMKGTLLSLTGKGQIDLPQWLVHYLLTPVVVTNRGSQLDAASGISVPVQVEGSLDSPSYHPDLRGALEEGLKDPEKLKQNLKNVKENLKDIKDIKKSLSKEGLQNLLR